MTPVAKGRGASTLVDWDASLPDTERRSPTLRLAYQRSDRPSWWRTSRERRRWRARNWSHPALARRVTMLSAFQTDTASTIATPATSLSSRDAAPPSTGMMTSSATQPMTNAEATMAEANEIDPVIASAKTRGCSRTRRAMSASPDRRTASGDSSAVGVAGAAGAAGAGAAVDTSVPIGSGPRASRHPGAGARGGATRRRGPGRLGG